MKNLINLNKSDWLEIVFANRNKEYGAYNLRKNNNRNHFIALIAIASLAAVIWLSYSIYMYLKPEYTHPLKNNAVEKIITIDLNKLPEVPVNIPKDESQKTKTTAKQASTNTTSTLKESRFVSPKVVDKPVKDDIPSFDDLKKSVISNTNIEGIESVGNTLKSKGGTESFGNGADDGTENTQNIFTEVEIYPEFLGGKKAWANFINETLKYPESAQETNISGKVIVQFVIEKNGQLTDIKVIKSLHKSLDEAAVQALQKSPRWRPGFQNGLPVRVRFSIPIHFNLQ